MLKSSSAHSQRLDLSLSFLNIILTVFVKEGVVEVVVSLVIGVDIVLVLEVEITVETAVELMVEVRYTVEVILGVDFVGQLANVAEDH